MFYSLRHIRDLTLNLGLISAYELNELTMQELISRVVQRMNEVIDLIKAMGSVNNATISTLEKRIEEIEKNIDNNVEDYLNKILENGKLEEIINDFIFCTLNKKINELEYKMNNLKISGDNLIKDSMYNKIITSETNTIFSKEFNNLYNRKHLFKICGKYLDNSQKLNCLLEYSDGDKNYTENIKIENIEKIYSIPIQMKTEKEKFSVRITLSFCPDLSNFPPVKNIMMLNYLTLREGNITTDSWSPAISEVENWIKELEKNINEVVEEIKTINNKIVELQNSVNQDIETINSKLKKLQQQFEDFKDKTEKSIIEINKKNDEQSTQIKDISNLTNHLKFDLLKITPSFFKNLKSSEETVLQTLWIDPDTDHIYTTKVWYGPKGTSESFGITHFNEKGEYVDWCRCKYGGHGSSLGLYKEGGKLYFFSNWDKVNENGDYIGHDMVLFPYIPRVTFEPNDSRFRKFNTFEDIYMNPVTDQNNDIIAFRVKYSEKNQVIKVRKLSEFMKGIDNVIGQFTIPSNLYYCQGFDIEGDYFYYRTGDTNSQTSPDEIIIFNWHTGEIVQRRICDFGYPAKDNFREPEGLSVYKDKKTGLISLFCSLTTGEVGMRECNVYAYHQDGNFSKWEGLIKENYQMTPLCDVDGLCFQVPKNLTSLGDFKEAGWYYFTQSIAKNIKDLPKSADKESGYFLHNSPNNEFVAGEGKALVQTLIRNGKSSFDKWERCLQRKENEATWYKHNVTAD